MDTLRTILIIIIALCFITLNIFCILYTVKLLNPKQRYGVKLHEEYFYNKYHTNPNDLVKREKVVFLLSDGYIINAEVSIVNDSKKFVILSHGITSTRIGVIRHAALFNSLGYNTIIYDMRGHGDNLPFKCSLGPQEAKDLNEIINQTYDKFGKELYLGLFGASLGAATSILVLDYKPNIKFVIEDSGYADLCTVPQDKASDIVHLPRFIFTPFLRIYAYLFCGVRYTKIRPSESLKKSKIPVLILHCENDNFVKVSNAFTLKECANKESQLHIFSGSSHINALGDHKTEYENVVKDFLEKVEEK